jgi:hypothetical protein
VAKIRAIFVRKCVVECVAVVIGGQVNVAVGLFCARDACRTIRRVLLLR